jgi:hypothetical protein
MAVTTALVAQQPHIDLQGGGLTPFQPQRVSRKGLGKRVYPEGLCQIYICGLLGILYGYHFALLLFIEDPCLALV